MMYQTLIFLHSIFRWLVLLSLFCSIFRAWKGHSSRREFTGSDHSLRHWTATIAHIQLVLGITLYTQSPLVLYFWKNFDQAKASLDLLFFGLIHIGLMLTAVVLITIGSSMTKRKKDDREKFRTMLVYYGIALLIIFLAVPWPFSPLAHRPYLR